jgi:hypothetical protein
MGRFVSGGELTAKSERLRDFLNDPHDQLLAARPR